MADARDVACWTNHAAEQLREKAYTPSMDPFGSPLQGALAEEPWEYVLDFGCGTGLWRGMFGTKGTYMGADQNAAMVEGARQRWPHDTFVQAEGTNDGKPLPFVSGSFDVVFTSAVLQHNIYADQEKIVREFNRVLKIGGRYIGFENTYGPLNPGTPDNYTRTREGWRELFEDLGFELVRQSEAQHPVQIFRKVRDL